MSIFTDIQKFLQNLLQKISGPTPSSPPDSPGSGSQPIQAVKRKVMLVVFDPMLPSEGGKRLSKVMGWNDVNQLAAGYIEDLRKVSYGYANFEIVVRFDADRIPVKEDGFVYTAEDYLAIQRSGDSSRFHQPDLANYLPLVQTYDLVGRVNRGEIDEAWFFGFPYCGFYESRMAGPGAFWCNGPALTGTEPCSRRFVMMGFNYERGVGEMLESFAHRCESIMDYVYRNKSEDANLYKRFIRYEKAAPGKAEIGSVHYAPNSQRDYEWGSHAKVLTRCRNWEKFPDLSGAPVELDCAEWGNGDIRLHHQWWLGHLPHISGGYDGIDYNWWRYVVDPNQVK